MSITCRDGFITDYLKNISLTCKEAENKGITANEFAAIDSNNNGKIEFSEFLNKGITNNKVKSVFATLSGDNYNKNFGNRSFENKEQVDKIKKAPDDEKKETGNKKSYTKNPFSKEIVHSLNHPVIDKNGVAKVFDYFC